MRKFVYFILSLSLLALAGCVVTTKDNYTILLDKENLNLYMTQTHTLDYKIQNNNIDVVKEVIITSNNESVVTVEGNVITALKDGFATITISLKDNLEISKSINVTVQKNLSVIASKTNLFINDNITLVYEDKADLANLGVTFESTDESVVKVDKKGVVTAVGKGEAVVITRSKTNSVAVSIKFTVAIVEIQDVLIENQPIEVNIFDQFQLIGKVLPANANQEVTWSSSNPNVATVDEFGHVNILNKGEFTITLTSKQDSSKQQTYTYNVNVNPIKILTNMNIENPLRQYVTSYGYNPDERQQWVNGSVNYYFNSSLNLDVRIINVTQNKYTGTVANKDTIQDAENQMAVRSGILHPETKYIIYHDTGNHTPGANAEMHAAYLIGNDNATNRARSWHYTVDENKVIQHIPDNEVSWQGDHFDAYAYGIGIETCVDFGSDLYTTWQRTAKLMAMLMEKYNIGLNAIKQHHDFDIPLATGGFWNKDCPRTLRNANLYDYAIDLIRAEYIVRTVLKDYQISFTSLNQEIVDNRGKIIKTPATATRVGYIVNIKGENYNESTVLYSVIPGADGTTSVNLNGNAEDLQKAKNFDLAVAKLPEVITKNDISKVQSARSIYEDLNDVQKSLTTTFNLLKAKELELHQLDSIATPVMISQILLSNNSVTRYGYIELYNPTNKDISLEGWTLQFAEGNNAFTTDVSKLNTQWISFNSGDVIKAKGYYLIQVKEGNNSGSAYLPLADYVSSILLTDSGKIVLANNNTAVTSVNDVNIVDLFAYNNVTISETNSYDGARNGALVRWGLIDTNNNSKDFILGTVSPKNSRNDIINLTPSAIQEHAMEVDTFINSLPRTLTLSDETKVIEARNKYEALLNEEKALVKLLSLLEDKEVEMMGVKDPNIALIFDVVRKIPKKINNDFTFPTTNGIIYSYKDSEDTSMFNLQTGVFTKSKFEYKPTTIVASIGDTKYEFQINFGLLDQGQITVFNTGSIAPKSGGQTQDGKGSFDEQLANIGFGGISIVVDNKVYFIGEGSFIKLNKPASGNTLTINHLRPYGSSSDTTALYNQSLIKGVSTAYKGDGVLYFNDSDVALTFDPSLTYGRNNSSTYGYGKLVFSPNADGTYTVQKKWADTGTNTTTNGTLQTLQPGEFLYCPHTYNTNQNGGTWLMQEGSGYTGVLSAGKVIKINYYKPAL